MTLSLSSTVGGAPTPAEPSPVVLDYGDPAAEYGALRAGALLVDHGDRALWLFQGAQARETLSGLVTNDVAALEPGHGQYAAALTPKGRIIADVRILALANDAVAPRATNATDGSTAPRPPRASAAQASVPNATWPPDAALLVDVSARAAEGWSALVRKYVNPRVAAYRSLAGRARSFGLYGAHARDVLADVFSLAPSAVAALAPYAHATIETRDGALVLARVPDLGLDGFVLYAAEPARDAAWQRVERASGVTLGGQRAYDVARIEAGRPAWGLDMDETTIAQEANLDELHAISYTKGCYTGQEVVARVHFRGHVNRHLRGLTYAADAGTLAGGTRLVDGEGNEVGDVRSAAISPRLGGVAIGMVRREIAVGATLTARADGADDRTVTISALPFSL